MTRPVRTWVLIADGARARVLESRGSGVALTEVPAMRREAKLLPSRELGDDKPGRSNAPGEPGRHALEPTSDPHREGKRQFVREVVDALCEQLDAGAFERLVVVAPPVSLGDLRAESPGRLAKCIHAEVAMDLTKVPDHEVKGHLRDVVGI